ncbi:MAG: fructosamine kinase family protein [Gammaproteobacteria bacterium]|nr:fructosamine kinase family protein [Gammaproteobacteria bacterium]
MNWSDIEQQIGSHTGDVFSLERKQSIGGGSINDAYHVSGSGQDYFIKYNNASKLDMFEAESDGLKSILCSTSIRVPRVLFTGISNNYSFIVLEYIDLSGPQNPELMGEQLACMHRLTENRFGWFRDNTIGATRQCNDWHADWVEFWTDCRLGYQLELAARNGIGSNAVKQCELLRSHVSDFFGNYTPEASLLHGDLWSGNAAFDKSGLPVIFDPATYYGDREADIAMTELFGGFSQGFYQAYNENWALDRGYKIRKNLYNQYHILNHFNLFGGGYGQQAEHMAMQLLAECR